MKSPEMNKNMNLLKRYRKYKCIKFLINLFPTFSNRYSRYIRITIHTSSLNVEKLEDPLKPVTNTYTTVQTVKKFRGGTRTRNIQPRDLLLPNAPQKPLIITIYVGH